MAAEFPIGHTIGRGAFRVERHLQGEGKQQLFAGSDTLIALDLLPNRIDIDAVGKTMTYEHPGVFALAYLGRLDMLPDVDYEDQRSRWALVEEVTAGSWLPSLLGTYEPYIMYEPESRMLPSHDPSVAAQNALSLGRSAGKILATAAADGNVLAYVRPELMWAKRVGGSVEVTGLSARAHTFFAKTTTDAVSLPLFDRCYYAPEVHDDVDDRALVFALAIMIAEWATGRFPFQRGLVATLGLCGILEASLEAFAMIDVICTQSGL